MERDNIKLNNPDAAFPYELTNGRPVGSSILWRILFDYSISKNLQATFNYDGRSESNRNVIHTGRAEIKAFFWKEKSVLEYAKSRFIQNRENVSIGKQITENKSVKTKTVIRTT